MSVRGGLQTSDILHEALPDDMQVVRPLPGIAPVTRPWLEVDDAYAAQMQLRRRLLEARPSEVLAETAQAGAALEELWDQATAVLPGLGFDRQSDGWMCPDGAFVPDGPHLATLGCLVQADLCVLEKPADASEHVLTGAVLCFPASWQLSDKIGRPLTQIHHPVAEYDPALARRVQRLFDGVQVGRPLWRFNRLWYQDASLYQPRSETQPRPMGAAPAPYLRCERQTVMRLPETRAVLFAIHTYVVARANVV